MLKIFLTEEAEEARNIAGRRPALFAADEDDEVKKFLSIETSLDEGFPGDPTRRDVKRAKSKERT